MGELCINGTPACTLVLLVDGKGLHHTFLCHLHIAQACGSLRLQQDFSIHPDGGIVGRFLQNALPTIHESIDGIHGVNWSIPCLGALRLEQPTLHLVDYLLGRSTLRSESITSLITQLLDSFDGSHLGRNLIVSPTVRCLSGIEVAPHLRAKDRILADALQIVGSLLLPAVLGKHHGGKSLACDSKLACPFGHVLNEIIYRCILGCGIFLVVQSQDIEIVQSLFTRADLLSVLCLLLLHLLHFPGSLILQVRDRASKERIDVALSANHLVETSHHLCHCGGNIPAAIHTFPPGEGSQRILQCLQLSHLRCQAERNLRLIEVIDEFCLLLTFLVGCHHPRSLVEDDVLQFLVLLQTAHQGSTRLISFSRSIAGCSLLLPEFHYLLDDRRRLHEIAGDAVAVDSRHQRDGIIVVHRIAQ